MPPPNKDAPSWSGPEAGFRTGFALPGGEVVSGKSFDPGKGMIPFWIDFGYRFNKYVFFGPYVNFGVAIQSDSSCTTGYSCHGIDFRLGGTVQLHVLPGARFNPWLGLGLGYEWYHVGTSGTPSVPGVWSRGFEIPNVSFGVLYKSSAYGGVGPFISIARARFSYIAGDAVPEVATHQWLMLGLHGTFWTEL